MKKTLLIVMAMMVLIAATGCRADDRKEEKPMTKPSAEVIPDNSMNDGDVMDGENSGEIPENGVDSGREDNAQNNTENSGGNTQNGAASNGVENADPEANVTVAPELVPSAEATLPNTSDDVKK